MAWISSLIGTLIAPLPLAVLAAVIGAVLWWRGLRRWAGGLWIATALALFLASWQPVAEGLLAPLENRHPPQVDIAERTEANAVVVLAAGWREDRPAYPPTARIPDSALVRLSEGIRLYNALEDARLILNDVSPSPEEAGYATFAQTMGVPDDHVARIEGPNTRAEAEAAREALGEDAAFLLVTSASHMPRAVGHFQAAGLDPIPAPTRQKTGLDPRDELDFWMPSAKALSASPCRAASSCQRNSRNGVTWSCSGVGPSAAGALARRPALSEEAGNRLARRTQRRSASIVTWVSRRASGSTPMTVDRLRRRRCSV